MLYTAPADLYSLLILLHNYSDFTQRRALISDCKTAKTEGKIQKGQCRVKSLSLQKVPGKNVAKDDCEKTPLSLGNKGTHACMLLKGGGKERVWGIGLHCDITFILLHTDGSAWPGRRGDSDFWDNAAKFVRTFARVDHLRTGIKICVYNVILYYCLCNVNQEEHAEQRS